MAANGTGICRGALTLALMVVGLGCAHPATQPNADMPSRLRQRPQAAAQPETPLRIPGPAAPSPSGVVQASQTTQPPVAPPPVTPNTSLELPGPPQPAPPSLVPSPSGPNLTSTDATADLVRLYRQSAERVAQLDSYIACMHRREQVNGKDQPEEIIEFKYRREPFSIHMKWIGKEATGREVVYVKGRYEGKIHILPSRQDSPIVFAMSFPPDSPQVRERSRHPITDAGISGLVDGFGLLVNNMQKSDRSRGTLTYLGTQRRPEFANPVEAVEQVMPPNLDPLLPRGGKRLWFFEPQARLPLLVIMYDDRGHEVEYYFYDRVMFPVRLDDDDFNPTKLGAKK